MTHTKWSEEKLAELAAKIDAAAVAHWEKQVIETAMEMFSVRLMGCATAYMLTEPTHLLACRNLARAQVGLEPYTMKEHEKAMGRKKS